MIYDIAIIGSGPAGLTAAIYTTRGNARTVILAGTRWGGQLMLTTNVENYPGFESILGPELMEKMKAHVLKFGADFIERDVESVDFAKHPFLLTADDQEYEARSVIIATGASTRWLGLASEERLIGRGVSSCAPCDAPFFRDKSVVVVGGGDSAMEEALVLTKYATNVTIVHRRDEFRASKVMQDRVLSNSRIKVVWGSMVEEILGDDHVTGVQLKNVETQTITQLATDGVFVAIGHDPATKIFAGQLELDNKGYVKKVPNEKFKVQNEKGEVIGNKFPTMTSVEGVFVAGDVHDYHYRQAVTAAGFGCMAGMDALAWLDQQK